MCLCFQPVLQDYHGSDGINFLLAGRLSHVLFCSMAAESFVHWMYRESITIFQLLRKFSCRLANVRITAIVVQG